jgi:hypothetical protein
VDSSGNIVIVGSFRGTVNFGGGSLTSVVHPWLGPSKDIFIAKYSSSGVHMWSKSFGSMVDDVGYAVAIDSNDNILVTGSFRSDVNFGGGFLFSDSLNDVFIVKFAPNGAHLWSKNFLTMGDDVGKGIAVDGSDNVYIVGDFTGQMNFGNGYVASEGQRDIFFVKLLANGSYQWAKTFGSSGNEYAGDIVADSSNNIVMTASFMGTIDFGGEPLVSIGTSRLDVVVAKYAPSGIHMWSMRFGDAYDDFGYSIAVDSNDNIILTGSFQDAVDFGSGLKVSAGERDIFVSKYSPSGANFWSQTFGSSGADIGYSIAVDNSDSIVVTGLFQGTVDFGSGLLTSAGMCDIFLINLTP